MPSTQPDSHLEKVLQAVGDDGRYQKLLFWLFLVPISTLIPWTTLVAVFQTSVPDHWCHVPGKPNNLSLEEWKILTIPWQDGDDENGFSQCKQFYDRSEMESYNSSESTITECLNGWEYDKTWYDRTLATDRNWVCDKDSFSARWLSAGVAGNVVGNLVFNCLSDYWGRKNSVILTTQFYGVFAVARLFANSEWTLLIFMFLSSMPFPAILGVSLIWVMEQVSGDLRSQTTSVTFIMWTVGMCILPLMAWAIRDWVILGIVTSLPFIPFLGYWWLFAESPRWLLSKGRVNESYKAFKWIAEMNGTRCPDDLHESLCEIAEISRSFDRSSTSALIFVELFRYPVIRKRLLLLTLCQVCNNTIYYGIIYNMANISGNEFLNFFYLAISELPGILLGWFCSQKFGRRFSAVGFFFLATLTAFVAALVSNMDSWIVVFLPVTCKTLSNVSFLVLYIQLAENLPTSHRASGAGFASIVASLVGISTPYIAYSGSHMFALPYLILALIGLTGTIAALFIPETLGENLPQTISEAEVFLIDQSFWSYKGWRPRKKK